MPAHRPGPSILRCIALSAALFPAPGAFADDKPVKLVCDVTFVSRPPTGQTEKSREKIQVEISGPRGATEIHVKGAALSFDLGPIAPLLGLGFKFFDRSDDDKWDLSEVGQHGLASSLQTVEIDRHTGHFYFHGHSTDASGVPDDGEAAGFCEQVDTAKKKF